MQLFPDYSGTNEHIDPKGTVFISLRRLLCFYLDSQSPWFQPNDDMIPFTADYFLRDTSGTLTN